MANSTVWQSKWKPIAEARRVKRKTYRQAQTHKFKFSEATVIKFWGLIRRRAIKEWSIAVNNQLQPILL